MKRTVVLFDKKKGATVPFLLRLFQRSAFKQRLKLHA